MTALPPSPFLTDSVAPMPFAPDTAVAANISPQAPTAAAGPIRESSTATGGCQEAPAVETPNRSTAGLLDEIEHVHEIFYHARLLIAEDRAIHHRFVLDERKFMEAIEPPPLFLQFEKMS